jgi:hypothetical protein
VPERVGFTAESLAGAAAAVKCLGNGLLLVHKNVTP